MEGYAQTLTSASSRSWIIFLPQSFSLPTETPLGGQPQAFTPCTSPAAPQRALLRGGETGTYLVLERQELLVVGDLIRVLPRELCLLWDATHTLGWPDPSPTLPSPMSLLV